MPKPKPNQSKDEYISYCISYIKKNEPDKSGWSDGRLYKHCEGLWDKYRNNSNSELSDVLSSEKYKPFSFTSIGIGMMMMDNGKISMSELDTETKKGYTTVDAVVAVGDRFYGNIYVPSKVLKDTAKKWNGTYNDISHLATAYPAGFSAIENMEYITGYNSDAFFDESISAVRVKMHINHDAPKYKTWKNFVDTSRDAGRIPNVSIFGFSNFISMNVDDIPKGVKIPIDAVHNGKVIAMGDMFPFAITTCLKGKCDDVAGCGISTGFTSDGKKQECSSGYCNVSLNDEDSPSGETDDNKEDLEKIKRLKNRIKELK